MRKKSAWLWLGIAALAGLVIAVALQYLDKPRGETRERDAPKRIICMAPNIAETVFALGAGDRVVAVSDYTTYPPEAEQKPTVGGLYNPNLYRIAALRPDLVIIQHKHDKVEKLCADQGIPILTVNMEKNVHTILDAIRKLGAALGRKERADALCKQIQAELDSIQERVEHRPRVRVLFCLGRTPGTLRNLTTIGKSSFLTEIIHIAGGKNVFEDVQRDYPQVSLESILRRALEVIIEPYPGQTLSAERRHKHVADWQALPGLPAVRNNRIFLLTDDFITMPGPRIGKIAARLAGIFHPEVRDVP